MGYAYHIDEIFEMAVQMEKNGFEFYKAAADRVKGPENKGLLVRLAEMEGEHEKTFKTLRADLVGQEETDAVYDPDGEAALYLKSIVDAQVFFQREIDVSSMKEVLKEAVLAEKDAIAFYTGMRNMVKGDEGKVKIDAIISEEMSHVRILSEKLMSVDN